MSSLFWCCSIHNVFQQLLEFISYGAQCYINNLYDFFRDSPWYSWGPNIYLSFLSRYTLWQVLTIIIIIIIIII